MRFQNELNARIAHTTYGIHRYLNDVRSEHHSNWFVDALEQMQCDSCGAQMHTPNDEHFETGVGIREWKFVVSLVRRNSFI